jgi:endonuclease III related protein
MGRLRIKGAGMRILLRRRGIASAMDREMDVYERLLQSYGPQHWWPADSPFETIVGALLMPQTAWRNAAHAIRNLRAVGLLGVGELASAPIPAIRKQVRVAGLYRTKPRRLRDFCRHLLERSDGDLHRYFARPTDIVRADLLAQEGVGPETADTILLYAGGHPIFLVDAYTIRIGRRIGLFEADTYEAVQRHFEERVPADLSIRQEYHALLDEHAKVRCRATPQCDGCPVREICDVGLGLRSYIVK